MSIETLSRLAGGFMREDQERALREFVEYEPSPNDLPKINDAMLLLEAWRDWAWMNRAGGGYSPNPIWRTSSSRPEPISDDLALSIDKTIVSMGVSGKVIKRALLNNDYPVSAKFFDSIVLEFYDKFIG